MIGWAAKADRWRIFRYEQIKALKIFHIIIWEAQSFRMYPLVSVRAGRPGVRVRIGAREIKSPNCPE